MVQVFLLHCPKVESLGNRPVCAEFILKPREWESLLDSPWEMGGLFKQHAACWVRRDPRVPRQLKGLPHGLVDVALDVEPADRLVTITPFGTGGAVGYFTADRVWIQKLRGDVVQERSAPRRSFDGHPDRRTNRNVWSPLDRQRYISPKSSDITRASPQFHDFRRNQDTAVVRTFAHQMCIRVATGIGSHVETVRILAQHCTHGGADRPCSLNLKRVARCHSSCTSPCTRRGNSQRATYNNWRRMSTAMLGDPRTTQRRSGRMIAGYIHRPNRTTCVRTTSADRRTSLYKLCAQFRATAGAPNPNERQQQHELCHLRCTQRILTARTSVTTAPVVFWRSRISTGHSQAITAELSAACKSSLNANSTPIPFQTYGNR